MTRLAVLGLCGALAWAGPVGAQDAFDLVFRSGTLDALPEGSELRYDAAGADDEWGEVIVGLRPDDEVRVERPVEAEAGEEPAAQVLGRFPASIGNPIAMVFLERTVRTISEETGGSPYYIRNRMRDALAEAGEVEEVTVPWDGASVAAAEVVLTPFADDARRAELGPFVDLEIRVVVSEEVPGWYHSMSVEAPATERRDAYGATLALSEVEP
jgi:hypothetical protein